MRNIFSAISGPIIAFAAIICLFSCTPIENEPNVDVVDPIVDTTDTTNYCFGTEPVPQPFTAKTYGFGYNQQYTVNIYQDGEAPIQEYVIFLDDTTANANGEVLLFTEWNVDGVTMYMNYGDPMYEEEFVFYYFNLTNQLKCFKSEDLTIVINQ